MIARRWSFFAATSIVLLIAGAPVSAAAAPEPTVFTLRFDDLVIGVPQTESGAFPLARDAELVAFAWIEREGVMTQVDLEAEVCDSAGSCVDPAALGAGRPFAAGQVTVAVTVTLTAADPIPSGSIVGRLTFTDDDDELSGAGAHVLEQVAWGVAALLAGAALIGLARAGAMRGRSPVE